MSIQTASMRTADVSWLSKRRERGDEREGKR